MSNHLNTVVLVLVGGECLLILLTASSLLKELKKIDDKALLVEVSCMKQPTVQCVPASTVWCGLCTLQVQLLESQAYQKIGNVNRSRFVYF